MGFPEIFIVTICLFYVSMAQLQPGGRQTGALTCASNFDQNLGRRCFEPRGLSFDGVMNLVMNNLTGRLPPGETVESFRTKVCRPEEIDISIPCVGQFMTFLINQPNCTVQERELIRNTGVQLIRILDVMCDDPCARVSTGQVVECLATSQIEPVSFLQANMTSDRFSFIGNTTESAKRFCGKRHELFTCMKQVMQNCPSGQKRLYQMGFDASAMEVAADLLCQQQDNYFAALQCFTRPSQGVAQCREQMRGPERQVLDGRFNNGQVKPSEFMSRLCALRLNLVSCELRAYNQDCGANMAGLRNEMECRYLPKPCHDNPQFKAGLAQLCPTRPPGSGGHTTPRTGSGQNTTPKLKTTDVPGALSSKGVQISTALVAAVTVLCIAVMI